MLEAGAILANKYRLTKPAGFGGMAQLWVATNEATGAHVCVKILVPERSDDESVERFRREAYAAARLSHRAIVRIFDLVELDVHGETTSSGKPAALAIVMELLHGETLADLLMKRGKLTTDETIDLALPFLSALAHAHRAGVVHRDLKPDNIFLATDPDGHVIPKVLDFGVSKMAAIVARGTHVSGVSSPPVTLDGVMLGTPSFMSPEQASGSRQIDARSDVFSAGIVMYMMLAGKNPFQSEQFHSVVSAIIHLQPARPSGVVDAIWEVIERALAKDREARYADATELGIALRRASGRTSTTDSGPQSGIGFTPARAIVPPLGGDSIVTVPPAGLAEEGADSVPPRAAAVVAARRRAVTIVGGVAAVAAVLVVVALLRSPGGSGPASASGTSNAAGTAAPVIATGTGSAASRSTSEVSGTFTGADAGGGAKVLPRVKPPAKKRDPHHEPSIVRDPGF